MQSVKAVLIIICFSNIVCILPVLNYVPSSKRINILNFHLIFRLMNLPRTISNVIIDLITEKKSKTFSFAHSHIDKTIYKKNNFLSSLLCVDVAGWYISNWKVNFTMSSLLMLVPV